MAAQRDQVYNYRASRDAIPKLLSRVLIVDDDDSIVDLLSDVLQEEGFETLGALDGDTALNIVAGERLDLVVLDLKLPIKDGFQVLEEIRQSSRVPVIIISGQYVHTDAKVVCLSMGADDYLTKPFANAELVARCRAVLRRADMAVPRPVFAAGDIRIDFGRHQVNVAGSQVNLTKTEYDLLKVLVINSGIVVDYDHLVRKVWGLQNEYPKGYVHLYVHRLRSKIEPDTRNPRHILSVPGVGYLFSS